MTTGDITQQYSTRSKNLHNKEVVSQKNNSSTELDEIMPLDETENNINNISKFDATINDRKIHDTRQTISKEPQVDENIIETIDRTSEKFDDAMLWHVRIGHVSVEYLKQFQRKYPEIKNLKNVKFDEEIRKCEVCLTSKFNRLPFNNVRTRATKPL